MASFKIDGTSKPGVLLVRLEGPISADEMRAFTAAHNAAIDALRGSAFRVFVDLREMQPLSPEAAAALQDAKAYSAAHANFQGSAVLVASSLVAMQHRRTSVASGVMDTELISDDEAACWEHLRNVQRPRGG